MRSVTVTVTETCPYWTGVEQLNVTNEGEKQGPEQSLLHIYSPTVVHYPVGNWSFLPSSITYLRGEIGQRYTGRGYGVSPLVER